MTLPPRIRIDRPGKVCPNCGIAFGRKEYMNNREWAEIIFCGRLCALKARAIPIAERLALYSRRNPLNGCLEWTGYRDLKGYGRLSETETGEVLAHRIAYIQAYGPITQGMHVLHHCDNEPCIEPAHLYEGTNDDNMEDRIARGQLTRLQGEANGRAKLSAAQVRAIRLDGRPHVTIAEIYGVSQPTISSIRRWATWGHL